MSERLYRSALIKILADYDKPELVKALSSFVLNYTRCSTLTVDSPPIESQPYAVEQVGSILGCCDQAIDFIHNSKPLTVEPCQLAAVCKLLDETNIQYTVTPSQR